MINEMTKYISNIFIGILFFVGCSSGSDALLKFDKAETIYDDSARSIVVTTYFTNDGIINLPVWVVKEVMKSSGKEKCLFTVERVFQESEPGYPVLDIKNNNISDSSASYSYSLTGKKFITNKIPSRIYAGLYRKPDAK